MKQADGLQISRIEDILEDAGEKVVELPGWSSAKPFVAKLRRVSLLDKMREGKIPNHLVGAVMELYQTATVKSSGNMKVLAETMLYIAGLALVEPTMQALTEAGIELTDLQVTKIYTFAMQGVDALRPFRPVKGVLEGGGNRPDVADAAKRVAEGG